ncbi:type I-E CRISPR-associated protein Cas5/CasD [Geobacter argillaceus]|uniref:CRISPR-associated protein, Cas5e family n=1 Tax=Geobacter argillaceus TaxID=345631 RepID=A0A562VKI2_9BACT|nr:type I-E CRISPR-associated protein Cas5/CasD [Geobacter argillaceus]TWJ18388.1 CRISPR-associated protein, Cas5e family [Geobacter argillaceus]
MSSDKSFLALRLEGPLQSWGFDSQYNRRNTGLMPTKSAIAGMCCAALGLSRGSAGEQEFLASFVKMSMTAIAIPRNGVKKELPVRRLQDYHTVQNTRTAEGKNKDCHITHRQYLTDASFGVLLEGDASLLKQVADALENPVWGVWLGRKTCIPTAPVLAGLRDSREEALRLLIGGRALETFTRQEEVESFADGRDSLPDMPVSFATERRSFSPRRVRTRQAGEIG